MAASRGPFIVADLETTGLNSNVDSILEIGALRVAPDGTVEGEFSVLVGGGSTITPKITDLTGITQKMIDRDGRPLVEAIRSFLQFVGDRPAFFHNAPFDQRFIRRACDEVGEAFENRVFDTLELGRFTWPDLQNHRLESLARHVGAPPPSHRAISDARATLGVLLAARARSSSSD
ncbi:MAG: 3'-5' exonuclease [Burkholderiaceae bacterium]|nr:3'-5' exonuclease [Burkholderiaceae bacterium]